MSGRVRVEEIAVSHRGTAEELLITGEHQSMNLCGAGLREMTWVTVFHREIKYAPISSSICLTATVTSYLSDSHLF